MKTTNNMELKAYTILHNIKHSIFTSILQECITLVKYEKDEDKKKERALELVEKIANPEKWDYCGLLREGDKKVMETLEYLLDDEQKCILGYKSWT